MSVENFDGDGFTDQPSIIYSFETDDSGDVEIRELSRSGFGEVGPSPGDVIERETTTSDPTDSLPELELTGQGGLYRTIAVRIFQRLPASGTILQTQQAVENPSTSGAPVQTQLANEIGLLRSSARLSAQPGNSKASAGHSTLDTTGRKISISIMSWPHRRMDSLLTPRLH